MDDEQRWHLRRMAAGAHIVMVGEKGPWPVLAFSDGGDPPLAIVTGSLLQEGWAETLDGKMYITEKGRRALEAA